MVESELAELLWRSFYLGMRVERPDFPEKFVTCLNTLRAIARNETTLHQPQFDLVGLDASTKRIVKGIASHGVAADHDLASLIIARLNQLTASEESVESLPIHTDHPPLRVEEGGVVRVGKSRVSLDLVVNQYENGATPEEIVRAFDTLTLPDVYAVIAYYLRHPDDVRNYLKRRAEEAEALRAKIEAERPRITREELLARRAAAEKNHASTGQ